MRSILLLLAAHGTAGLRPPPPPPPARPLLETATRYRLKCPIFLLPVALTIASATAPALAALVPVDISSTDSVVSRAADIERQAALLPDTTIQTLDGGFNLGFLLFTFVLYNGLFGKAGRPADWVLPALAKVTQQENKGWFANYKEGYFYNVPPAVEALRVLLFGLTALGVETAWINAFDGDTFWAWSTGICLALPSSLIALSRDPLSTREQAQFDAELRERFNEFASARLTRGDRSVSCSELNIVVSFRRSCAKYRTEDDVSDKALRKVIRKWVGYKDLSGRYLGVAMVNKRKEVQEGLAKNMARAAAVEEEEVDDEGTGEEVTMAVPPANKQFDNEFVRKK